MDNGLFNSVYNPDVLSCIANLSNDEVFTSPEIANKMLDLLPQELFENPDTTFLDPVCKSGVFLREIAKRLIVGLEPQIPNLEKRLEHIFTKQLYGISITELTSLLSRRSVYCSKYPSSQFSVYQFPEKQPQGNIIFQRIKHTWENNKCKYCGASKSEYDREEGLETHAYQFIHNVDIKRLFNMKFDVIIGNPPYQLSDGGTGSSAKSIYHLFIQQAKKLNPRFLTMIVPARWYTNGKGEGVKEFRENMLTDNHISVLLDYKNSADCFPGVNIAGGVCIFLWDRDKKGECRVDNVDKGSIISTSRRYLNEFPVLVRDNVALNIIHKIQKKEKRSVSQIVKSYSYFAVRSYERGETKQVKKDDVLLLSSGGRGYFSKDKITDKENILGKYKVIITYAMSGGNKPSSSGDYQIISSEQILLPNEICTETYLILGVFDTKVEAENYLSYVKTKFFRFLLLQALTSIHITKDSFLFVPVEDFSESITDTYLYDKYELDEVERQFIETIIRQL